MEPVFFKPFEAQVFDHIINYENTEFIHVFGLPGFKNFRKDCFDDVMCERHSAVLMRFKKYTNELGNSYLNFLLHFNLLSNHFLFFFINIFFIYKVFAMCFFLITAFKEIKNFF